MAYPTNSDLKTYIGITNTNEDTLLTTIINAAKSYVERRANRTFEGSSSTKNFPIRRPYVSDDRLVLHTMQDFAAYTAVTNGDGVAFTIATELEVEPIDPPYHKILVKPTSGKVFYSVSDARIAVTATWGYSTTIPPAIFEAMVELGANMYRRRMTGTAGAVQQIGQAGLIVQPADIPATVQSVIDSFRRYA